MKTESLWLYQPVSRSPALLHLFTRLRHRNLFFDSTVRTGSSLLLYNHHSCFCPEFSKYANHFCVCGTQTLMHTRQWLYYWAISLTQLYHRLCLYVVSMCMYMYVFIYLQVLIVYPAFSSQELAHQFCCFLLRQGLSTQLWLAWISLCRPSWP